MGRVTRTGRAGRSLGQYFDQIVHCAPEEERDLLSGLFDDLAPDGFLRDLTRLTVAAERSLDQAERSLTPVPYLDLTTLTRETVVCRLVSRRGVQKPSCTWTAVKGTGWKG